MTSNFDIVLPSKPRVVSETDLAGVYEIDGLYPGYGHTLGNSLRRIILSSLPGAAVTLVKIDGVPHEFSTIEGVKEDVITILLNLKRIRFKVLTNEPQIIVISIKGIKTVTAADSKVPGQVEILNPDQFIATLTDKKASLGIELRVQKGLGYVSKENLNNEKTEVGTIAVDATFTPIRRVNYEVENMRVGDRTDYNRLRITIETDGTFTPREALEISIQTMVQQLQAIVGFQTQEVIIEDEQLLKSTKKEEQKQINKKTEEMNAEFLKTRLDTLNFSTRTANALDVAKLRTIGGLARKKASDILALDGLGEKGLWEIRKVLGNFGIILKD
ncbi:DNA-directed RNA polymerase subunit alpha [Patescibacteria group bacterium]|nr:DNA-directed RNA polymerase subunit alpha [Patescibacteria group bacterium]MBU2010411.1 DNA-directed RNA polymerase subunit alpha [Patescibacteria group bacterium]